MKECMTTTMCGETAYYLKHIEDNEGISVNQLRADIKNKLLKPSGKSFGAYYVIQSDLDRYLNIVNGKLDITDEQITLMKKALGLNRNKKPYKNKYNAKADDRNWNDLICKKLAIRKGNTDWHSPDDTFSLTPEGVAYVLGKPISIFKYFELTKYSEGF